MDEDAIRLALRSYPGLVLNKNPLRIEGKFTLKDKADKELAAYRIKIMITWSSFRTCFPDVFLLDNLLTWHIDRHIYKTGKLCLATRFKQALTYQVRKLELDEFLNNVLAPFLATQTLIEEGQLTEFPQGERSHGTLGLVEEYTEFFSVDTPEEAVNYLQAYLDKLGRNSCCFCGSGNKYKRCHLSDLKKINFVDRGILKKDYTLIREWIEKGKPDEMGLFGS